MKYKIVISSEKFPLSNTDRNKQVVEKIQRGEFPGLVTLDVPRGSIVVNLSEAAPFVLTAIQQGARVG